MEFPTATDAARIMGLGFGGGVIGGAAGAAIEAPLDVVEAKSAAWGGPPTAVGGRL